MTQAQQIEALATDLDKLIDRYFHEYDLPAASVVGVLSLKTHLIIKEWDDDTKQPPDA